MRPLRRLNLQVQLSVDGYMAGCRGEMDWLTLDWDEALKQYVADLTEPVDWIVLGRKLAQSFIPHWAAVAENPDEPEFKAGQKFTATPKVVFSRTLTELAGPNTVVVTGELTQEIRALKNQPGQTIMAHGGSSFVWALLQAGLIDEFHLFVNPTAIGSGLSFSTTLAGRQPLTLPGQDLCLRHCGAALRDPGCGVIKRPPYSLTDHHYPSPRPLGASARTNLSEL